MSNKHCYQVWFQFAKWFRNRILKCETFTDNDNNADDDGYKVMTTAHMTFGMLNFGRYENHWNVEDHNLSNIYVKFGFKWSEKKMINVYEAVMDADNADECRVDNILF